MCLKPLFCCQKYIIKKVLLFFNLTLFLTPSDRAILWFVDYKSASLFGDSQTTEQRLEGPCHPFLQCQTSPCLSREEKLCFINTCFIFFSTPVKYTFSLGVIKSLMFIEETGQRVFHCPWVILPHCKRKVIKRGERLVTSGYVFYFFTGFVGLC